ncbi:MAG: HU family DNA-binding protein [Bacteroidales bacterium]|nr:HU family DNA-binding protein [Bacteroidales bacterium]
MIKIVTAYHAQPGIKGGGNYKYYGRISGRKQINFRQVANTLSRRTTMSTADVAAAVEGFREIIVEELMAGNNVKLDGLGIFSLSLSTEAVDNPSKLNKTHIRDLKIQFRPDPELKEILKTANFQFQKPAGTLES